MARKKQKLSEYETKTVAEIKQLSDNAYIPLFTGNVVNNKENLDFISEKLIPGDNIQIDNNDKISATDTKYTAGENIKIVNNTISYDGPIPRTYRATNGLKLTRSKLSSNIAGTLGSKLEPVTFSNNYTLGSAGYAMDSVMVTRRSQSGQSRKPYLYITPDAFIVIDTTTQAPSYFYENQETGERRWAIPSTVPTGYELIKPTEYSHIAINHAELQYLIIFTTFIKAMANKEIIINTINKPNDRTELWFFNDLEKPASYITYEQGLMLMSSEIAPQGFCKAVYYIAQEASYGTSYIQASDFGIGSSFKPPFCGNVISAAQDYTYDKLYSTLRFIPNVDESDPTSTHVSLVSTIY